MRSIRHQRNTDFINEYKKLVKSLGLRTRYITREDLIHHTLQQPAPRYYISEERVMRIITEYKRNPHYLEQLPTDYSRAMYRDLIAKSLFYHQMGLDLFEAVYKAIHEPAPSFFVSFRTARDYIVNNYYDRKRK